LRALENNEIRPVGSDKIVKTNVRIIAATHQNLDQKIQAGEFRSDLYYRLNVVSIFTPALKDRPEDFEEILYSFAKEMRVRFSYDAIQRLKAHTWPGNIRELRNLVARASALFTHRQIDLEKAERLLGGSSFHPHPLRETTASGQVSVIKEVERQIILKKLETNKGNQRKTAHELGMPKSTLNDRLRQYNINLGDFKKSSPPLFT
jgi:DNA-binding NtrC family response regulator